MYLVHFDENRNVEKKETLLGFFPIDKKEAECLANKNLNWKEIKLSSLTTVVKMTMRQLWLE